MPWVGKTMDRKAALRRQEQAAEQAFLEDMHRRNDAENERNRLATVYLVEATNYESHHLWVDYSEESKRHGWGDARIERVPWEQITLGYHKTIGRCARKPVHVSVTFARVKGQIIAFYEATSLVVDHRIVEQWTAKEFPSSRGKTNPMNFHLCLHALGGS